MRGTMAQTPSTPLPEPSDAWFKDMGAIVATLQGNPWRAPLMAAWTLENAIQDTDLASELEWRWENEQRWSVWRQCLRQRLQDLREHINYCAPDRIPQLKNSRLWRMAHLPDSVKGFSERRTYSKDQCLADLQNLTNLVK